MSKKISHNKNFNNHGISDQNNHTMLEDVIEYYDQISNHEILLKDKAANLKAKKEEKNDAHFTILKKFEKSLLNFLEYSTLGGLSEL
jgi:hypothetical protein